jgi:integrase
MLPPGNTGIDLHTLAMFITWAAGKYKYNTIASTMSALVDWHKSKGIEYPAISCRSTKELLATVKAEQGPAGLPAGKQGLSKAMLNLLLLHLRRQSKKTPTMSEIYLRDQCAFLLGFYGMLRRSEIASLALEDITVGTTDNKPFVELHIKQSKTDRGRVGASVTITGVTTDGIDIIGPLQQYIARRAKFAPSQTSPLFTSWDLDARTCTAATPISGQALAVRLQQYLETIKAKHPSIEVNPSSYGMHSLRRGGVIAAWEAGVDIEKIKSHGRWRSDAVRAYMQATRAIRLQVTGSM